MKRMVCKHCGQEIKKQINFDRLKACWDKEALDEWIEKLCQKGCPLRKICSIEPLVNDGTCVMNILKEWLFEEMKQ